MSEKKCIFILIFSLLFIPAASAVGVGVAPAELNFSVQVGSSESRILYVINTGTEESGYKVYVDEKYRDWFTISPENFTLAPNENKAVHISLSPPISASGNFSILVYAVSYSPSSEFRVGGGIKVPANAKVSNSGMLLISGALMATGLVFYMRRKKKHDQDSSGQHRGCADTHSASDGCVEL
jgi:LPXTG-motif cell wall-anchored protein